MQNYLRMFRTQLVAALPSADLWQETSPWMSTVAVLDVRGVLILAEKLNNFEVRIGIQTATSDIETPDVALNPSFTANLGTGYITTVSKNYFQFDPTNASNGNIGTKAFFRLGLLYRSTDTVVSRGDVILRATYRT